MKDYDNLKTMIILRNKIKKYEDLELAIISCFLKKPELIEKTILTEDNFKNHVRLFKFLKTFYKKFGCFDIVLMVQASKDKYKMVELYTNLIDYDVFTFNFEKYQAELLELQKQDEEEQKIINNIYDLANDLYIGLISLEQFKEELKMIERGDNGELQANTRY